MESQDKSQITCSQCKYFTKDSIGNGEGVGQCKSFNAFLQTNPSKQQINVQLRKYDCVYPIFWAGKNTHRKCEIFSQC